MGRLMDRAREIAGNVRDNAADRQDARRENRNNGGGVVNRVRDGIAAGRDRIDANRAARDEERAYREQEREDRIAQRAADKIAKDDPRVTKERTRTADREQAPARDAVTGDLPRAGTGTGERARQPIEQRILKNSILRTQEPSSAPSSASQPSTQPASRPSGELARKGQPRSNTGLYIGVGVGVVGVAGLLWWALR